jgi:putative Holliday junction resolvase
MPVIKPEDMRNAVAAGNRLLGFDLGSKTIGLALTDTGWTVASPLKTLRRGKFRDNAGELLQIFEDHGVGGLVLGLPINMDGSEGPRCQATRAFARNMLEKRDLPIVFQDERLSTAAVERMMISEMDLTRKRQGELVDKLAAAYILQIFLDWATQHRPEDSGTPDP